MRENRDIALASELLKVQRTLGWMDLVIGNITDAVYVVDKDSRLIFVNQYFSDILNVSRIFLLGRKLNEVFDTKLIREHNTEFLLSPEPSNDTKDKSTNICEWQTRDQHKIFNISSRYITTIKQTVFIAKDITTEYELSVMKSNFINIASHQLRTPMTTIMVYAHMLHDGYGGKIDDKQNILVKNIIDSSERMISLINDILLISRVQNGEENLNARDGKLIEAINTLEAELKPKLNDKHLQFETDYSVGVKNVHCNKFLVHEILSNLLTNGIQYTPMGGIISLKIKTTKNKVKITVSDNGIGIPNDYMPEIYKQFSRAQNAFEIFNEGTGLGLYIVKIMVDQINGTIDCISEVNKGTTFTVVFPI